jgi:hypothetical protein
MEHVSTVYITIYSIHSSPLLLFELLSRLIAAAKGNVGVLFGFAVKEQQSL